MITIEEQKRIMLNILDSVDSYCREHSLKYFLAYGTLLGAVRHKGFIPWDDDIDIWMFRSDYEKFIFEYKDRSNRYKVIGPDNCQNYHLPFAKVIDTNTKLIEDVDNPPDIGTYIDIFPIDFLPEEYEQRKKIVKRISLLYKLLNLKKIKISNERGFTKNMILRIGKIVLSPISRERLIKDINAYACDESRATSYCGAITAFTYGEKEIMSADLFENVIELDFEDRSYFAPSGYHKILKHFYGDYMKLPPKEKQLTHHGYSVDWRHRQS